LLRNRMKPDLSRRQFLQTGAAGLAGAGQQDSEANQPARPGPRSQPPPRQRQPRGKLAVVTTAYHYLSHAYHICGRFLHGYLRYELFQRIVEVFRKSARSVPVFCDKHLYYDRKRARAMYDTARQIGFPLMAGSSLPITWRRPELDLRIGTRVREALVASRGEL